MKKLKKLLPALIAVALALVVAFAVACSGSCGCNCNPGEEETLDSISLNTENAKTTFAVGEEYSSEGLVVTAKVVKDGATEDRNVELTDEHLVINKDEYKKDTAGEYTITVSYTLGGTTKDSSYKVNVKDGVRGPGLRVKLATGVSDTINLSESAKTASIDISKIVVEVVSESGETLDTLAANQYTAALYKGTEKLTETTELTAGVYQIWATANKSYILEDGWHPTDFVLVYVNNNVVSISFDKDHATLSQREGADEITSTWKFTATYADGTTADVSDKVTFDPKVDTTKVGADQETTASYTEKNSKQEDVTVTMSEKISYTIIARPTPTGIVTYTVRHYIGTDGKWTYEWNSNASGVQEDDYLKEDHDGYVTVAVKKDADTLEGTTKSGGKSYTDATEHSENNRTFTHYAEFKNSRYGEIKVSKFASEVKVAFYTWASSTSNGMKRIAYLGKVLPTGTVDITATSDTEITNRGTLPTDDQIIARAKLESSDAIQRVEGQISEQGTYYVSANNTTRVAEIDITYTVDYSKIATFFNAVDFASQTDKFNPDSGNFLADSIEWSATASSADKNMKLTVTSKSGKASKIGTDSSGKTIDGLGTVNKYIDMQGSVSGTAPDCTAAVKLTLTKPCKITYYALAGKNNTTDRWVILKNSNNTVVYNSDGSAGMLAAKNAAAITAYTIDVTQAMIDATKDKDGVFFLGSGNSGIYIYAIKIA